MLINETEIPHTVLKCGLCKKLWTVFDADMYAGKKVYCSHCGHHVEVKMTHDVVPVHRIGNSK